MTTARGRSGTGDPGPAARPSVASRVLLVEDEPGLLRALFINLRARRYDVITASTGHEALATAANRPPDAVILDLGLPDIDGTEVIVELRRWSRAPIIVLSGRASPGDKIGALDVGADDYVTKPFSMAELLARLRAVLRRDDPGPAGVTEAVVGHCVIDLTTHTVTRRPERGTEAGAQHAGSRSGASRSGASRSGARGRRTVRLTPTEWRILETLVHHPGQLVGSRQLLTDIWGPGYGPAPTTSGSTWPGCAGSWKTTRRGPVTCSPNRAWATGTGHESRPRREITGSAPMVTLPQGRGQGRLGYGGAEPPDVRNRRAGERG